MRVLDVETVLLAVRLKTMYPLSEKIKFVTEGSCIGCVSTVIILKIRKTLRLYISLLCASIVIMLPVKMFARWLLHPTVMKG